MGCSQSSLDAASRPSSPVHHSAPVAAPTAKNAPTAGDATSSAVQHAENNGHHASTAKDHHVAAAEPVVAAAPAVAHVPTPANAKPTPAHVEPPKPVEAKKPEVKSASEPAAPKPSVIKAAAPAKPTPTPAAAAAPAKSATAVAPSPAPTPAPAAAPPAGGPQLITPYVGFVIKTRDINSNEKIFVNILYHERVKAMIPVGAKHSTDKKGEHCLAYSVVLPSSLFQLSHKFDSPEINQVSLSSIDLVNKTFSVQLDPDFKIPRMKRGFVGDDVDTVLLPEETTPPPTAAPSKPSPAQQQHKEPAPLPPAPAVKKAPEPAPAPAPVAHSAPHNPTTAPAAVPAPAPAHKPEPAPGKVAAKQPEPEPEYPPLEVPAVPAAAEPTPAPAVVSPPEETEVFVAPVSRPVPPKMHGWLKKRGHVVLNWKSRYFVLDNGYLTYFVDKLDVPPFGKDMKGQLCLAGYRDVPITEETAGSSSSKRNTSAAEEALWANRLHLVYDPSLYDQGQKTANAEEFQDLLLEAASADEKAAWLTAIQAHTEYFESTLTLGASLLTGNGASTTPAAAAIAGHRTGSVAGAPRLQSVSGRSSTSNYSVVDDNKRWMIFLHAGEEIVLTGLTVKPNPVGVQHQRQLILTSHKRLLYIDGKSMEQKGEIEWSNNPVAEYPKIKQLDNSTFEIAESAKKTYKFITKDMLNATNWVHAVEATVKK